MLGATVPARPCDCLASLRQQAIFAAPPLARVELRLRTRHEPLTVAGAVPVRRAHLLIRHVEASADARTTRAGPSWLREAGPGVAGHGCILRACGRCHSPPRRTHTAWTAMSRAPAPNVRR